MKSMKTTVKCLRADKKTVLDKVIVYRLFLVRGGTERYYAIKASADKDSSSCKFGTIRAKAFDIYRKIVRNEVTPCSLRDIAEDFEKEIR